MRRFLSIVLIGTLALGIASCAKEPSPSTATSETTEVTAEVTTEASAEAPADNSDDKFVSAYPAFKVTSESLDGKYWSKTCAFQGDNLSPQLSWEPVEGATTYVIYMVDLTAANIIHWKKDGITETNLPRGWATSAFSQGETSHADYVGPNPPSGSTNQYNIYVFALKAPVERVKGSLGTPAIKLQDFMDSLDTDAEGNSGNIVAVGRIVGYYAVKT